MTQAKLLEALRARAKGQAKAVRMLIGFCERDGWTNTVNIDMLADHTRELGKTMKEMNQV